MAAKHNSLVGESPINCWYIKMFKKLFCRKKNKGRKRRTYTQMNFVKFNILLLLWRHFYKNVKFSMTIDNKHSK
jgi:hypothetical protein